VFSKESTSSKSQSQTLTSQYPKSNVQASQYAKQLIQNRDKRESQQKSTLVQICPSQRQSTVAMCSLTNEQNSSPRAWLEVNKLGLLCWSTKSQNSPNRSSQIWSK